MIKGLFKDKVIKKKISLMLICIVLLSLAGGGIYYYVHYSIKVPIKPSLEKLKATSESLMNQGVTDKMNTEKVVNEKAYFGFSGGDISCQEITDSSSFEGAIKNGDIQVSEKDEYKKFPSYVGAQEPIDYGSTSYFFSDKNECEQAGKDTFSWSKKDKEEMDIADKEKKIYLEEGKVKFTYSIGPKESHTPCVETTQNINNILDQFSGDRESYKKEKLPYIGKHVLELGLDGDGVSYLTSTNFFYSNKEGCEAALKKRYKKK